MATMKSKYLQILLNFSASSFAKKKAMSTSKHMLFLQKQVKNKVDSV